MMKSDDGWDDEMKNDREDEYYVKGGARRRKEGVAAGEEEMGQEGKTVVNVGKWNDNTQICHYARLKYNAIE